jgi:hypothetical protein
VVGARAVGLGTDTDLPVAPTPVAALLPACPNLLFLAVASADKFAYLPIVAWRLECVLVVVVLVVGPGAAVLGTILDPPFAPTPVAPLHLPACTVLTCFADAKASCPERLAHFAITRTHLHDHERVLHEGIRTVHKAETHRLRRGLATLAMRSARTEQYGEQDTVWAFHGFTRAHSFGAVSGGRPLGW